MEIITKICRKCGKEKSLAEFTKDRRNVGGYHNICKDCKNAAAKIRYQKIKNDPEFHRKKIEASRKYKESHREQIRLAALEYNNRPEVIQRKADWYYRKQNNMSIEDRLKEMAHRASTRAREKCVPYEITWKDLQYVEYCPILNIKLNWEYTRNEEGRVENTPSLDRIDPKLGYVKGNVRIISNLANMMKSSATRIQLETFCKNIINYLDSKDIVQTIENNESIES